MYVITRSTCLPDEKKDDKTYFYIKLIDAASSATHSLLLP